MATVRENLQKVKDSISWPVVASVVVALALVGGVTYVAARSGVKPLKAAAKVLKGG